MAEFIDGFIYLGEGTLQLGVARQREGGQLRQAPMDHASVTACEEQGHAQAVIGDAVTVASRLTDDQAVRRACPCLKYCLRRVDL